MTEDEVINQFSDAEKEYQIAKKTISNLKKKLMEAESVLIHSKINMEKAFEAKRVFYNTTFLPEELDQREKEIEAFRKKYPELCQKDKRQ